MKPHYTDDRVRLYHGDCRDIMEGQLPDNSVDSIVTDPPYELGFMGKGWDGSGIAYNCEVWENAYRILKPGGHLLAFGGTRTWHRLAVAIEDAGFEVRDSIAWMYGSGFPKSHDVSKGIDKSDAKDEQQHRRFKFTAWVQSQGVTAKQIDEATNTFMGSHYTTHPTQPAIMTREHLETCRHLFADVPRWVELQCDKRSVESKNFASREVVGSYATDMGGLGGERLGQAGGDITAPATPAAQQWQGWGTALKPAHEPIVVARKPLIGTVAENVLTHGTGALNIDGCRIGTDESWGGRSLENPKPLQGLAGGDGLNAQTSPSHTAGRWPANVILDESQAAALDAQSGVSVTRPSSGTTDKTTRNAMAGGAMYSAPTSLNDTGGASRFFYVAKAGKKERPNVNGVAHPTVKPMALMQYLVRLVTPPGGIVLEPFAGSGTTIEAALNEGFNVIGIEMTDEYLPLIMARIERYGDKLC
jgi:site-specific DNA-methyltransferase (adenine-specific)